jgi:hypothetical protein
VPNIPLTMALTMAEMAAMDIIFEDPKMKLRDALCYCCADAAGSRATSTYQYNTCNNLNMCSIIASRPLSGGKNTELNLRTPFCATRMNSHCPNLITISTSQFLYFYNV